MCSRRISELVGRFRVPDGTPAPSETPEERAARIEREEAEAIARSVLASGYRRACVDLGFSDDARGGRMWDAMASGCPGFLLFGGVGTGKTSAARGAARAAVRAGRTALLWTERELVDNLRSAAIEGGDSEAALVRRLRGVGLLAIDDMGKAEVTPKMFARLFELVDKRVTRGLPTVATSNYRPRDLIARYASSVDAVDAQALVSRLSTLEPVETSGPDLRVAGRGPAHGRG